jgi:hypothetical protein
MKKSVKYLVASLLFIGMATSCKVGMYSESKGKEQEAYLQIFQSQTSYPDGVVVVVDDQQPFMAKVNKDKKMNVKGNLYTIPTGRHHLKITAGGKLIYDKEIFISSQETKQITLP